MTNDVNKFINDFKDSKISKIEIFEAFEYDVFTLEEQKYIFDNLKTKQKCQLYNTISVEARNKYCEYLDALEPVINDKGKKVVYFDEFMSSIRSQAVKDAKIMEQQLLDNGMCTRDWSIEQIRDMYNFTGKGDYSSTTSSAHQYTPFGDYEYTVSVTEKGKVSVNIKTVAGHHMMAVKDFPEYMADGKTIQFLEVDEHLDAHGGFNPNATLAFYDGENYIGIKYNDPYINEFGEYVAGEFVGDGKMYKFVAETGSG